MLQLKDIMTRDVITVPPDLSIRNAMDLLARHHISGAPVVTGGRVVGVISASDLLTFVSSLPAVRSRPAETALAMGQDDAEGADDFARWDDAADPSAVYFSEMWEDSAEELDEQFGQSNGLASDVLAARTVAEAMSDVVYSLPSLAAVPSAARYMRLAGVHRLPVIDDARLVGIVSAMDITRAVAEGRLTARTYVFGEPRSFDGRPAPRAPSSIRRSP